MAAAAGAGHLQECGHRRAFPVRFSDRGMTRSGLCSGLCSGLWVQSSVQGSAQGSARDSVQHSGSTRCGRLLRGADLGGSAPGTGRAAGWAAGWRPRARRARGVSVPCCTRDRGEEVVAASSQGATCIRALMHPWPRGRGDGRAGPAPPAGRAARDRPDDGAGTGGGSAAAGSRPCPEIRHADEPRGRRCRRHGCATRTGDPSRRPAVRPRKRPRRAAGLRSGSPGTTGEARGPRPPKRSGRPREPRRRPGPATG